ncbi:hypothetical protein [Bradyrhizobium sp. BWA-3-5]|uniref:hypothetical protein n=1 Tax=Bradyrhizobium sp. BWA-3-5 TaxID=3080013 RepID=UPI00293EED1F|nr:hypothetical protein [Bradyrhizobium sp. BWA-3-5]WOH66044.1 hypothetical protein RX331_36955 [Bradyrhizobium sp. BWA-3-5]
MIAKPTADDYLQSVIAELGFENAQLAERAYQFNMRAAHQSALSSPELGQITAQLRSMPERYAHGRQDLLFYPAIPQELPLLIKPFASMLDKLYRSNVLYNRQYPDAPAEGGIESSQLYEKIEDLLRTRLVCKYLDGPRFVCEDLKQFCDRNGIQSKFRELSTAAGYYAWHFYLQVSVELMLDTKVVPKNVWVEIQVSTQLAEVLTILTHELYEARRSSGPGPKNNDWKWDASSHDFRSAYLGHGLHLIEGVIQNLKDDLLRQPLAKDDGSASLLAKSAPLSEKQSSTNPDSLKASSDDGKKA